MKRIPILIAAIVTLAALLSPAPQATHRLAHQAASCATDLASCPLAGCGGGDPKLNTKKNRTDLPADTSELWTFEEILHLEDERPGTWMEGQDRTEVEELGEDTPIMLKGFLIGAHAGSPETCNCKLTGAANNDIHINIVQNRTDKMADSIVTEMTPRIRSAHTGWDTAQSRFNKLLANGKRPYVRVTGYLLFDSEHVSGNGGARATIWEIHPITSFDVCTSTQSSCDQGKNWTSLEKWKPAPAAPPKKG